MARTPRHHSASQRDFLNRRTLVNASSSPSVSASPYVKAHTTDNHMAVDRDPFSEESLRASIESFPLITCMEEVPYSLTAYNPVQENFFSTSGSTSFCPRFFFIRHATSFPVLSHISHNVRRWGGRFVRITAVAGFRPFWLPANLWPLFPLRWSAFRSPPSVPLSDLSEVEQANQRQAVDMSSPPNSLDRAIGIIVAESISPRPAPGFSGETSSSARLIQTSVPASSSIFERLRSHRTRETSHCFKNEAVVENSRCRGMEPMGEQKEKAPCLSGGPVFYMCCVRSPGGRVLADLAEDMLRQASTLGELNRVRRELVHARWTIRELDEALSTKNFMISKMNHARLGHVGSSDVGVSGVEQEPTSPSGPPPGFDQLVKKSREEEDSEDDQF
ncbi:uncharacterized protein G2W53_041194 [Senna tora]|uniref:Uncharacterized protein n=1 Tax=Senna tora TaxID=362788 RepID=A0A834VXS3_9FABA|nr:uncharacterized protein G2W53_041194 [Senna tora]